MAGIVVSGSVFTSLVVDRIVIPDDIVLSFYLTDIVSQKQAC